MIEAIVNPKRPETSRNSKKRKREYRYERIYVMDRRVFILCNKLIEIASKAGMDLIPHDIASVFFARPDYEEQINLVAKFGKFIK